MIDFDQPLKNLDGSNITEFERDPAKPEGPPRAVIVTLGKLCSSGLVAGLANEQVSGEEHLKRFMLATTIRSGKHELTSDNISLIKARLTKSYTQPLLVGQAILMLDPAEAKDTEKAKAA